MISMAMHYRRHVCCEQTVPFDLVSLDTCLFVCLLNPNRAQRKRIRMMDALQWEWILAIRKSSPPRPALVQLGELNLGLVVNNR